MDATYHIIPNFKLEATAELSSICRKMGIDSFHQAINYIFQLPYGRNSTKENLALVFTEACGTCSTKHAVLVQLALEHAHTDIQLVLGIYSMNALNTPGVAAVLEAHHLTALPEAHNYIIYQKERIDITNLSPASASPFDDLYEEVLINPSQIGEFKIKYHQNFLVNWLKAENLPYDLAEIWSIREACIAALAQK